MPKNDLVRGNACHVNPHDLNLFKGTIDRTISTRKSQMKSHALKVFCIIIRFLVVSGKR